MHRACYMIFGLVSNEIHPRAWLLRDLFMYSHLIDRAFSPGEKSLFCRAIAPIRRGFTSSEIWVEKGREGGGFFLPRFDEAPLLDSFVSFSSAIYVSPFRISYRWQQPFSVSCNLIRAYHTLVYSVSHVDIFIWQRIFFICTRAREKNATGSFYNEILF